MLQRRWGGGWSYPSGTIEPRDEGKGGFSETGKLKVHSLHTWKVSLRQILQHQSGTVCRSRHRPYGRYFGVDRLSCDQLQACLRRKAELLLSEYRVPEPPRHEREVYSWWRQCLISGGILLGCSAVHLHHTMGPATNGTVIWRFDVTFTSQATGLSKFYTTLSDLS
jgi:hypothetical protein